MPNIFETQNSNIDEADFTDEPVQSSFDGERQITLQYGTEKVTVDITSPGYMGKNLGQIAAMRADELGFSREATRLNYRLAGSYVESTFIPKPGQVFVLSTSADTKGDPKAQ